MTDMNEAIRWALDRRRGHNEATEAEPDDTPEPQPDFGRGHGRPFILNPPRARTMNDRIQVAFDDRPRAGTYRIG